MGYNRHTPMKKWTILFCALIISITSFAEALRLSDGNVIMWQRETTKIQYESYRVEIVLYQTSEFNVFGTVSLGNQTKNFIIYAGETSTYVDFDNLTNGKYYPISVKINNTSDVRFPQN